jgi:hypothetical protein
MLNFAYDTPVKLLSVHVILMCAYLVIPDLRALFDFFVRNKAAAPAPIQPHFASRRMRIAAAVAKTLFLGYLLVGSAIWLSQGVQQYGSGAPKSPLYGIWDVEEFTRDGETLPPLLTDKVRWRRMVTEHPNSITIFGMDDSARPFAVRFYAAKSAIVSDYPQTALALTWSRPDADHLTLTGTVNGHQVVAQMKRLDESKTNLFGRGFHWVSERPFNR